MSIIGLQKANCKNCYKCIKVCPVKSIRLASEQAQIIEADCILCGKCLNTCPQNAKTLSSDLDKVKGFLKNGKRVIFSLAPSYYTSFDFDDERKLLGAFQRLGIFGTAQTADGAAYVTAEYHKLIKAHEMENIITTCCPTVNDLVEKYYPELIPYLAPVVSPMIAHGRLLKETYGHDAKVVFVGPCIAKKAEADDIRHETEIDAVLTFHDMHMWLEQEEICVNNCEPADFLRGDSEILRLYPIAGGIIKTLKRREGGDLPHYNIMSIDGIDNCKDVLDAIRAGQITGSFIEINACVSGCINGPARVSSAHDRFTGRIRIKEHVHTTGDGYPALTNVIPMHKGFVDRTDKREIPSEEVIRSILQKIGKDSPAQELNCGSCGYATCRDKAIAVYQGKAELTMCMPFMRQRAESLSNVVLTETPNITIIVDEDLNIVEYNAAAEKAFGVSRAAALTKGLYEILDPADTLAVFDSRQPIFDKKITVDAYHKTFLESIVYIKEGNYCMGIFKDITEEEALKEKSQKLRMDTVDMAQKVIDKQMVVAQEIASLLGETTAETKVTLTKLKDMIARDDTRD